MPVLNFNAALKYATLAYAVTFVAGILVSALMHIDVASHTVPNTVWYIGMVVTAIVMAWCGSLYLKKAPVVSMTSGAMFGVVVILFGFVVDYIFFSIAQMAGQPISIVEYYANPFFFATVAIALITPALLARHMQR